MFGLQRLTVAGPASRVAPRQAQLCPARAYSYGKATSTPSKDAVNPEHPKKPSDSDTVDQEKANTVAGEHSPQLANQEEADVSGQDHQKPPEEFQKDSTDKEVGEARKGS